MAFIPHDESLDSTAAALREGYTFIGRRCRRYRSDLFQTRLMLRPAVCLTGEEAARVFYAPDRFTRRGAMPPTTLWLLQDVGSVATLDGEAHRRRKALFLTLLSPERVERLADLVENIWRSRIGEWAGRDAVVLHDEVEGILCRAVCAWSGAPLAEEDAERRTREFRAMIEGAGAVGPRMWQGLLRRIRTERWARAAIEQVRFGRLAVPEGSALELIARHQDGEDQPLDVETAAVELLNVLRPTVAVARFVTFAALALHDHPDWGPRLRTGDDAYLEAFVQEVRRFFPFFPFVGGRVLRPFDWRGYHFAAGTWTLLDLYGTDHDPRTWERPEEFRPERFLGREDNAFNFIPQGGGDYLTSHRCPGEPLTIALMKRSVRLLTTAMRYDVPAQDLGVDLGRMPAIPASRFVIANVRTESDVPGVSNAELTGRRSPAAATASSRINPHGARSED